ncbi:MAG: hypothetical protein R3F61_09685 [Myxococcota bacterium]
MSVISSRIVRKIAVVTAQGEDIPFTEGLPPEMRGFLCEAMDVLDPAVYASDPCVRFER